MDRCRRLVGRQQAFAVIANKCSAAQALCLKQVRETRLYEKLDLTWDEFCKEYAGIGRAYADRLIQQHEEFGEAYFRLSEIARISPEPTGRSRARCRTRALSSTAGNWL